MNNDTGFSYFFLRGNKHIRVLGDESDELDIKIKLFVRR